MTARATAFGLLCVGMIIIVSCATGSTEGEDEGTGRNTGAGATSTASAEASAAVTNGSSGGAASSTSSTTGPTSASSSAMASASSAVASSSSTGGNCPVAQPTNVHGCPSCGALCDSPWPVSWNPVSGATHYIVEYTCILSNSYQTPNVSADLCNEVGMCNDSLCANGAGPVTVQACDTTCCSAAVQVPLSETPIACGGGVCC